MRFSLSIRSSLCSLRGLPPLPLDGVYHAHTGQLFIDLVFIEWDLVGLFGCGPEALGGEAVIEIRAEVVHPADGEDHVYAELGVELAGMTLAENPNAPIVYGLPATHLEDFKIGPGQLAEDLRHDEGLRLVFFSFAVVDRPGMAGTVSFDKALLYANLGIYGITTQKPINCRSSITEWCHSQSRT